MLNQSRVFDALTRQDICFFTGVPDSYLNGFCNYALSNYEDRNVIAANEGNAIGIASGYYISTGKIPLVYMQNSGMGNSVNPLVSLADENVYSIPMILLIGWRGQGDSEPNHPQHKLQGEITTGLLDLMNIPYTILSDSEDEFDHVIKVAADYCRTNRKAYALISPKGIMAEKAKANLVNENYPLSREEAIEIILNNTPPNAIFCATTGRATRELYYLRERRGEGKECDFLNVGSMGHVSSVALGIALNCKNRKVVVLDGDSAAIMHMGAFTMMSKLEVPNLIHVVLNNGVHESVGGQPSAGYLIDFTSIAQACGYNTIGKPVENSSELTDALIKLMNCNGPGFIDCRIHKGLSHELPEIVFDHKSAVTNLMNELKSDI